MAKKNTLLSQNINDLNDAISLIHSWTPEVGTILDQDLVAERLKLLEPTLIKMRDVESTLPQLAPQDLQAVQDTIVNLQKALETLLAAFERERLNTVSQMKAVKDHSRGAKAYVAGNRRLN